MLRLILQSGTTLCYISRPTQEDIWGHPVRFMLRGVSLYVGSQHSDSVELRWATQLNCTGNLFSIMTFGSKFVDHRSIR